MHDTLSHSEPPRAGARHSSRFYFRDADAHLRNGWKILGFIVVLACVMTPLVLGLRALPTDMRAFIPKVAVLVGGILLASWICVRAEGGSLAEIGFALDARFGRQLASGAAAGIAMLALVAALIWLCGGFEMMATHRSTFPMLFKAAAIELGIGAMEELGYRGYPFQRAIRGIGFRWAQIVFAALFCASHPLDASMSGLAMALAMANIFMFALLMGNFYRRTKSLAVPIGFHAGWNWMEQGMGFGVSGIASSGWWSPAYLGKADWLTGGAFGPEASALTTLTLVLVLASMTRWQSRS